MKIKAIILSLVLGLSCLMSSSSQAVSSTKLVYGTAAFLACEEFVRTSCDERKGLQLLRRCAAGAVVLVIAANAVSKFDLYGGSRSNDKAAKAIAGTLIGGLCGAITGLFASK